MLSPKEIMILNLVFSSSLGMVALLILAASLKRPAVFKRAQLFLYVRRDGVLFRKVPIGAGQYRIGRGNQCDILLEGMGIPVVAGEIIAANKFFFKTVSGYPVTKNSGVTPPEFEIEPGDEVGFFNYSMRLENG
jgi:hypothetical protein